VKVFVSVDMEGISGVTDPEDVLPNGSEYQTCRRYMTGDANAAIAGAYDAGAEAVLVNDSHWIMRNLLIHDLDKRAKVIKGFHNPPCMLQGLDDGFDAAFFIGYHGAIGEPEAVLAHTYSPRTVWEAKVDGRMVGEIGINTLVCEYFGVPIRLVSGDQATVLEARDVVPGVHVAEVKRSFSRYSAESLSPMESRAVIKREAEQCLGAIPQGEPLRRQVSMELTFMLPDMAGMGEWIRGVERTGPRSVVFRAPDGLEAYRTFYTILMLTRSIVE